MRSTDYHQRYWHPHYILSTKLFLQSDGTLLVTSGNVRMEVSPDEVHALLCGILDYAAVFARLHQQIDVTALAILNENSKENGNSQDRK